MEAVTFKQAIPVRPANCPDDKSDVFFFSAELPAEASKLKIGGHSVYRIFLNGRFYGYGPARAPHGYAKIDCLDLHLTEPKNTLEIELFQEGGPTYFIPAGGLFLIVEVVDKQGRVLLATGESSQFICRRHPWRCWFGCKHSDQRFSLEGYDLTRESKPEILRLEKARELKYVERRSPTAETEVIIDAEFCGTGVVGKLPEPLLPAQVQRYVPDFQEDYVLSNWRFRGVKTGFLKIHFQARKEGTFYIVYGENLPESGILNHNVWWGNYLIPIRMSAGQEWDFECFDVHTLQYFSVIYAPDSLEVSDCALREYAFPRRLLRYPRQNNPLAQAAIETFRQCTVDVFSDCPDRERAAWLCDSFFSARSAYYLTGNTLLEEEFIDNFLASPEVVTAGHAGLFPMCYPADITDNIPQWTLWFILELEEYLRDRQGKTNYPRLYQERLRQVFQWFEAYVNKYGLLENLPGWNFIDCSAASNFATGVNYPTNLLYAQALEVASAWFQDQEMKRRAENIRQLTKERGMRHGRLLDSDQFEATSEAAQYYALYFASDLFPEISVETAPDTPYPSGLLMAKMMRYELLFRQGKRTKLQEELQRDFLPMVQRTGTLWEKLFEAKPWYEQTSCCHCFGTAIILWL